MQSRLAILFIYSALLLACQKSNVNEQDCKSVGFMQKEYSTIAGDNISIELNETINCPATVVIYGGPYLKELEVSIGTKSIDLNFIDIAGVYYLKLLNHKGNNAELRLTILANIGRNISDFIGPKSQSFYSDPRVQSSFVIEDSLGNAVNFRDPIEEIIQKNKEYTTNQKVIIHDKYGHIEHDLDNEEGYVSLSFNDVKTKRKYINKETGCAVSANIAIKESLSFADNDQLIEIGANGLIDKNQDRIEDGTALQLYLLNNKQGLIAKYDSYSVGGKANFIIQSPNQAGTFTIKINACGNIIAKYAGLEIMAPVINYTYWSVQKNQIILEGISVNDAYELSDGKEVDIVIKSCTNTNRYKATKRDGLIRISLFDTKILDCPDLDIDILGIL